MTCPWNELLGILPMWLKCRLNEDAQRNLQELRLRIGSPPELNFGNRQLWLDKTVLIEDLNFILNTASQYSPWSVMTQSMGYITAPGGHRIGICGDFTIKDGKPSALRSISSICIRIARDFPGIGKDVDLGTGSLLILGPPGSGKTTLLRDLSRRISEKDTVVVVDERKEIFPPGFQKGKRMDVILGTPKDHGIGIALRTMGPDWIVVDEITAIRDSGILRHTAGCGVRLLASAHAFSVEDYKERPAYRQLWREAVFDKILVLNRSKMMTYERIVA